MLNSFFNNGSAAEEAKEDIKSLRLNGADGAYLSRSSWGTFTDSTAYTVSMWIKHADAANGSDQYLLARNGDGFVHFRGVGTLRWESSGERLNSTPKAYDNSGWMHVLFVQYSTSSREMFVNGESWGTENNEGGLASSGTFYIGADETGSNTFDGYIAEVYFVDGQALAASDFTLEDSNGDLRPKDYTGTFGNQGFYLDFSDDTNTTTIGQDSSGNGKDFTVSNISVTAGAGNDSLFDSPSRNGTDTGVGGEVFGNYATLDPHALENGGTLTNGNLEATLLGATSSGDRDMVLGTMQLSSGKWYFEVKPTAASGGNGVTRLWAGIAGEKFDFSDIRFDTVVYRNNGVGEILDDNTSLSTAPGSAGLNDVIGIAVDIDASLFSVYINGTFEGSGTWSTTEGPFRPVVANADGLVSTIDAEVNFGQRPFAHTAPSGYKALCSTNLAAPPFVKPETAANAVLWTGTGSSMSITGVGFSPDLVMIRGRNGTDTWLYDTVRGATKYIRTNSNAAEVTGASSLTSFDSDGFTLGITTNGAPFVAWCWKAGSSTVTNTDGTLTSDVRANTATGFSIIKYAGDQTAGSTVGHGLGAAPEFLMIKRYSAGTTDWAAYHVGMDATAPEDYYMRLNARTSRTNSSAYWNDTAPTSTVFTVGGNNATNSTSDHICYAWTSIPGFSKFGSYTGNGSADGTFVNLGFRPAIVLIKKATGTNSGEWTMQDSKRNGYNESNTRVGNEHIVISNDNAEENQLVHFFANGFQASANDDQANDSGITYVYAAWAEDPLNTALGR